MYSYAIIFSLLLQAWREALALVALIRFTFQREIPPFLVACAEYIIQQQQQQFYHEE